MANVEIDEAFETFLETVIVHLARHGEMPYAMAVKDLLAIAKSQKYRLEDLEH